MGSLSFHRRQRSRWKEVGSVVFYFLVFGFVLFCFFVIWHMKLDFTHCAIFTQLSKAVIILFLLGCSFGCLIAVSLLPSMNLRYVEGLWYTVVTVNFSSLTERLPSLSFVWKLFPLVVVNLLTCYSHYWSYKLQCRLLMYY